MVIFIRPIQTGRISAILHNYTIRILVADFRKVHTFINVLYIVLRIEECKDGSRGFYTIST
jgi:hypothetical protein